VDEIARSDFPDFIPQDHELAPLQHEHELLLVGAKVGLGVRTLGPGHEASLHELACDGLEDRRVPGADGHFFHIGTGVERHGKTSIREKSVDVSIFNPSLQSGEASPRTCS
jgi:hypothetical protein